MKSSKLDSYFTSTPTTFQEKQQDTVETYGALFPAKPTDSPLMAGAKATGNLPTSAFGLAKGIGSAILHPIQTVKGLGGIAVGGVQRLIPGQQAQEQKFDAFTSFLNERYGTSFGEKKFDYAEMLKTLQRTATNDPFGFATDILTLIEGGAGAIGKTSH